MNYLSPRNKFAGYPIGQEVKREDHANLVR